MEFSLRYTPVTGRLHTRYAPVRRSSAAYCYAPLPLDLHVLSLPLAFILSQDQTLHCKNCSLRFYVSRLMFYVLRSPLTSLTRLRVLIISYIMIDTRYLFLLIRFYELSFSGRKRLQRYNHFQNYQNIFSKKFGKRHILSVYQCYTHKIFLSNKLETGGRTARGKAENTVLCTSGGTELLKTKYLHINQ